MRRKQNRATVVWDGGTEDFICRDERCTIYEVHLAHAIDDTPEVIAARHYLWGWGRDPFEMPIERRPIEMLAACPRCGADLGQHCTTPRGQAHRERLKLSGEWMAGRPSIRQAGMSDRRTLKPIAVQVLDESILRAVSPHTIKPFTVLESAIHNDYGSCTSRRLHRRLEALCDEESILFLQLGEHGTPLSGYTTPDSPLLSDLHHAAEVIWRQLGDFCVAA